MLILAGLFRKCVVADNCACLPTPPFPAAWANPNLAVVPDRDLCLRVADLRRFQRVQRYRPRQRAIAGISLYGELPPTLLGGQPSGFLAALAYQPEHLAPRLSLLSAELLSYPEGSTTCDGWEPEMIS